MQRDGVEATIRVPFEGGNRPVPPSDSQLKRVQIPSEGSRPGRSSRTAQIVLTHNGLEGSSPRYPKAPWPGMPRRASQAAPPAIAEKQQCRVHRSASKARLRLDQRRIGRLLPYRWPLQRDPRRANNRFDEGMPALDTDSSSGNPPSRITCQLVHRRLQFIQSGTPRPAMQGGRTHTRGVARLKKECPSNQG